MAADHRYVLRDSVTWSVFFLAIIAVLWVAQRDRKSSPDLTDSQFAGRDIVPGHDPLVMQRYPAASKALEGIAVRLDAIPTY